MNWRDLPPVERAITIDLDEDGTKHVSQTFLRLHDRCARAGYLYLKYDGGVGAAQMNRGEVAHRAFAKITQHAIEERVSGEKVPPEIGLDFLEEVYLESPELIVPAAERDYCRAVVWNFCAGTTFNWREIIAVEQTLELRIGSYTIRGRLDLATMPHPFKIDVEDYKTSPHTPTQEEFEGDFQTTLYALLIAFGTIDGAPITLAPMVSEFGLRQTYPGAKLREDGTVASRYTTISRVELQSFLRDLELQIARLDAEQETQKWQPLPGTVCEECPCEVECPFPRHLRPDSQMAMANEDEAAKLATWIYMTRRRATRATRRLKGWAGHNHRTSVPIGGSDGDMEYRFETREEYVQMNREQLLADAEGAAEYGTPLDVNAYREKRSSTRFEPRKREES